MYRSAKWIPYWDRILSLHQQIPLGKPGTSDAESAGVVWFPQSAQSAETATKPVMAPWVTKSNGNCVASVEVFSFSHTVTRFLYAIIIVIIVGDGGNRDMYSIVWSFDRSWLNRWTCFALRLSDYAGSLYITESTPAQPVRPYDNWYGRTSAYFCKIPTSTTCPWMSLLFLPQVSYRDELELPLESKFHRLRN